MSLTMSHGNSMNRVHGIHVVVHSRENKQTDKPSRIAIHISGEELVEMF